MYEKNRKVTVTVTKAELDILIFQIRKVAKNYAHYIEEAEKGHPPGTNTIHAWAINEEMFKRIADELAGQV